MNRDGDVLTFETQGDTVVLRGYGEYYRTGYLTEEQRLESLTGFIDPAGGPFIAVGDDLGKFAKSLKGKIVKKIEIGNQQTIIHI